MKKVPKKGWIRYDLNDNFIRCFQMHLNFDIITCVL